MVILQRLDRLTRGGSAHGFWFEHECRCVGVELVFVGDDIPEGRYANLIKVAKYEAAQEQAELAGPERDPARCRKVFHQRRDDATASAPPRKSGKL